MRWRWPERHGSTFFKLCILMLLAAVAFDGSSRAIAQDTSTAPTSEPAETAGAVEAPELPGHQPFTTWDVGQGIPFEAMSAAEQDGVMRQAELAETNCGYDVAQKWSVYSHEMAELAAAETARRLAGLTGTDDIGVTR